MTGKAEIRYVSPVPFDGLLRVYCSITPGTMDHNDLIL